MSMNLTEIKGVSPIYTRFAQGYVPTGNQVAEFLAPSVRTPSRSGQVVTFGKQAFAIENTIRTPGANILRIQPEYSFKDFSVKQDALAATVYMEQVEEARAVGLEGFEVAALRLVLDKLTLGREKNVIDLVTNPALYETSCTGTVSTKWDDSASDPLKDILAAKEAVRAQIGATPNSMVVSSKVYNALISHPKIVSHYNPTSSEMLDEGMLARYFRLSRGFQVAERVEFDEATGTLTDIMGDEAILFYGPMGASQGTLSGAGNPFDRFTMSYAYQYVLDGYPMVYQFEFDRDTQSWVAPVILENTPVLTGLGATGKSGGGFLFTDLLT